MRAQCCEGFAGELCAVVCKYIRRCSIRSDPIVKEYMLTLMDLIRRVGFALVGLEYRSVIMRTDLISLAILGKGRKMSIATNSKSLVAGNSRR